MTFPDEDPDLVIVGVPHPMLKDQLKNRLLRFKEMVEFVSDGGQRLGWSFVIYRNTALVVAVESDVVLRVIVALEMRSFQHVVPQPVCLIL